MISLYPTSYDSRFTNMFEGAGMYYILSELNYQLHSAGGDILKPWPLKIIPILICVAFAASGCGDLGRTKQVKMSDLIVPITITEVLKHPEAEVLDYFQMSRADFEKLGGYMLEHERLFQTRPVILHQTHGIDQIQDPDLQLFAQRLFKEGTVKVVTSLNDNPSKQIDFIIDSDPGLYKQGIAYFSLPKLLEDDPSILSYVRNYKDLGGGWYYYVYHYQKIKEEDQYRELAWGHLSDEERSSLSTPKEKAIVTLEAGTNVAHWNGSRKPDMVVSVQFNTEVDGLLGPIKMFFDPVTKELVGSNLRY